jgi:hypothetical protein
LSATKNSGLSPAYASSSRRLNFELTCTSVPLRDSLDFLEKHADEPAAFWEAKEEVHEEGDEEGAPGGAAEAKVSSGAEVQLLGES